MVVNQSFNVLGVNLLNVVSLFLNQKSPLLIVGSLVKKGGGLFKAIHLGISTVDKKAVVIKSVTVLSATTPNSPKRRSVFHSTYQLNPPLIRKLQSHLQISMIEG